MVEDADGETSGEEERVDGGPRRRGRRRQRRLSGTVDGDDYDEGEGEEQQRGGDANGDDASDDYDEDDSFIATARSDGRAPSVAGPSQHNAECGACGILGGVAGKGPLLCCAGCPTAVHARCVSKAARGGGRGGRDWLCAVCSDD